MYKDRPISVPFEFPRSSDGRYYSVLTDDGVLKSRRKQLGLTQQEVADLAHIQLSQYQRLEAGEKYLEGTSMKIGLSVCAVLLLDPYDFVRLNVNQPDPSTMKPQEIFDNPIPEDLFLPKRAGRKPLRKEIMTVFVNYKGYSLLIPYDALNKLGDPSFVEIRWSIPDKRIIILPASNENEDAFDVPEQKYEYSFFALPMPITNESPISAMGWGKEAHSLESRLVYDEDENIALLIDLNTAIPTDGKGLKGTFLTPECLIDHSDDDDWDDVDWDDEEES